MLFLLRKLWCTAIVNDCLSRKLDISVAIARTESLYYYVDSEIMHHMVGLSRVKKAAYFWNLRSALHKHLPEIVQLLFIQSFKIYGSTALACSVLAELKLRYGAVVAQVHSAALLPKDTLVHLHKLLEDRCKRAISVDVVIDKALLRGMVIRWLSYKLDISLAGELVHIGRRFKVNAMRVLGSVQLD